MTRFPSLTHAEHIDDRTVELNDGFVRLGDDDTPFTLRGGGDTLEAAQQIHDARDADERTIDEESNEPVTRSVADWEANLTRLDFPFVDTIPLEEQRKRANQLAEVALEEGFVNDISRDVPFDRETVRGKHWPGPKLIELRTTSDDFPGFQEGVVLAHELGHAFYEAWTPDSGIEEGPRLFQTTDEQEQAQELSIRLHGPFIEVDGPFVDYRCGSDGELAAAVFASRIIEPEAAERLAPDAVRRMEDAWGDLSEQLF